MMPLAEVKADLAVEMPPDCDCIWKEPHDADCDYQRREGRYYAAKERLAADVPHLLDAVNGLLSGWRPVEDQ